jgi:outer membrane protein OmpA-like peptidoglycan-associated protein
VYEGTGPEARARTAIERAGLLFSKGQSRPAPGQDAAVRAIASELQTLNEAARVSGRRTRVEIIGHTDTDGTIAENGPLSEARAKAVHALLPLAALDAIDFVTSGVGSDAPLTQGTTEADKGRNRRASFRVTIGGTTGSQRP